MKTPSARKRATAEPHQALDAIRRGEVDAIVVSDEAGPRLYALEPFAVPYQQMIDALPDPVLVLDDSGHITFCTATFCSRVGVEPSAVADTPLRDYMADDDRARFDELLVVARDAAAQAELTLHAVDGSIRVRIGLSPLPSVSFPEEDGQEPPAGYVAIVTDNLERDEAGRIDALLTRTDDLASGIANARAEERTHLSEQMNDVVLPVLTDVDLDLQWIDEKLRWTDGRPHSAVFARLRGVRDQLNALAGRARRFDPPLLRLGIEHALETRARQLRESSGLELQIEFRAGSGPVDRATELRIYRVVDQIITGLVLTSNASRVTIAIEHRDGMWQIESHDNARAVTPQPDPRRSSMIHGIRQYVSTLGGHLNIRTPGDRGTTLHIAVPAAPPSRRRGDTPTE